MIDVEINSLVGNASVTCVQKQKTLPVASKLVILYIFKSKFLPHQGPIA